MCCSLYTLEGVSCITAHMGRGGGGVAEYFECRNKKNGDLLFIWLSCTTLYIYLILILLVVIFIL